MGLARAIFIVENFLFFIASLGSLAYVALSYAALDHRTFITFSRVLSICLLTLLSLSLVLSFTGLVAAIVLSRCSLRIYVVFVSLLLVLYSAAVITCAASRKVWKETARLAWDAAGDDGRNSIMTKLDCDGRSHCLAKVDAYVHDHLAVVIGCAVGVAALLLVSIALAAAVSRQAKKASPRARRFGARGARGARADQPAGSPFTVLTPLLQDQHTQQQEQQQGHQQHHHHHHQHQLQNQNHHYPLTHQRQEHDQRRDLPPRPPYVPPGPLPPAGPLLLRQPVPERRLTLGDPAPWPASGSFMAPAGASHSLPVQPPSSSTGAHAHPPFASNQAASGSSSSLPLPPSAPSLRDVAPIVGAAASSAPHGGLEDAAEAGPVCAICLRGLINSGPVTTQECFHTFHDQCLAQWMSTLSNIGKNPTCPTCRNPITFKHLS